MTDKLFQSDWTFWYDYQKQKGGKPENWEDNLHEIASIDSVPSLLYVLDGMESAEEWPISSNVHFFRAGVKPAWEDKANVNGGKWVFEVNKNDPNLSKYWRNTVAFCASEMIKGELICGCVFSPRKYLHRFSIWTSVCDERVIEIARMWKNEIGAENGREIVFRVHQDVIEGGNYWNKSAFVVK